MTYIIGIDIGGTNTDAVLVDANDKIACATKTTTTEDISHSFNNVLQKLMEKSHIRSKEIEGVFVGTTHATNALLQKKDLCRVGVIRIAGHFPEMLPPAFGWPHELKESILAGVETINGGFQCDGSSLSPFCQEEAVRAIHNLCLQGVESIAIVCVFSPFNEKEEQQVADLIRQIKGDSFPITLSCEVGSIGFIERENSALLNACLTQVMRKGFSKLQSICHKMGITAPLMITQNDGSLIDIEDAIKFPVLTISAGPTNSFIGGAKLANISSAIVVDIGGTSTDVGLVRNGFPIRSLNLSNVGGVALNFPMPDVLSIAMGGGSVITIKDSHPTIGSMSIAKNLTKDSISFGGDQLTLTDVALSLGQIVIPHATTIHLPQELQDSVFKHASKKIHQLIIKMRGEHSHLPVIFVGGGAALFPSCYLEDNVSIPPISM